MNEDILHELAEMEKRLCEIAKVFPVFSVATFGILVDSNEIDLSDISVFDHVTEMNDPRLTKACFEGVEFFG